MPLQSRWPIPIIRDSEIKWTDVGYLKYIFIGVFILLAACDAKEKCGDPIGYCVDYDVVHKLQRSVKNDNRRQVAKMFNYPFARLYPLPPVADESEFIARYDEILDDILRKQIVESADKDWSAVGWRGVMLHYGIIWIDYDGKVYGINHSSLAERERRDKIIAADRAGLYKGLQNYDEPELMVENDKFLIRIDKLKGNNGMRYAAWPRGGSMLQKPDIVINHGWVEIQGTAHLIYYLFQNKDYVYIIDNELKLIVYKTTPEYFQKKQNYNGGYDMEALDIYARKILEQQGRRLWPDAAKK